MNLHLVLTVDEASYIISLLEHDMDLYEGSGDSTRLEELAHNVSIASKIGAAFFDQMRQFSPGGEIGKTN